MLEPIRGLDARIAGIDAQLAEQRLEPPSEVDRARMKKELRGMLGGFNELRDADVPLALPVLRKFLDGPISFDASSGSLRPEWQD